MTPARNKKSVLVLFSLCLIAAAWLAPDAQATSYLPGYEPYTYGYLMYVNPSTGPSLEYLGYLEGYLDAGWWDSVMKGWVHWDKPSFFGPASVVYTYGDYYWIVYFNPEGYSTQVIMMPGWLSFGALF
jgi:hypothetical protein